MHLKTYYTLLLTFIFATTLISQPKRDAQWIFDSATGSQFGTSLNFLNDTISVETLQKTTRMYLANASICDNDGNLLFYTNGCYVSNANHQLMQNGDSISTGIIGEFYCQPPSSSPKFQSILILPLPENPCLYYMIHHNNVQSISIDSNGGSAITSRHLTYSVIDMSLNEGLGAVTSKNQVILEDTLTGEGLQAVQHSNGFDWWIITPEYNTNCYYMYLLSNSGLTFHEKQCIGNTWEWEYHAGQSVFSPNGNIFARIKHNHELSIMNFDRLNGLFSNHKTILFPENQDTIAFVGVSISSNSRFLYTFMRSKVLQLDLEAQDIQNSQILVAEYDGANNPSPTIFKYGLLAPDNNIYIFSSYNSSLHTIEDPDSLGISCNLIQNSINLPNQIWHGVPNYPSFRLNTEQFVECDLIDNTIQELFEEDVFIYPNPVSETLFISTNLQDNIYVELFNTLGVSFFSKTYEQESSIYKIPVGHLPEGTYWLNCNINGVSFNKQIIIQK